MRISPRQSMKFLRSQKAGTLIGCLMLIIGLGAFVHAVKVTLDAKSAKNWVAHLAEVQSAGLTILENDKGVKSYAIDVAYVFDWQGTPIKGTRYRLHDKPSQNFEASNEIVQELLISKNDGRQYPIYVNPKNPVQSAVLNTVHPKAKSSSLFLGFLFSIIGYFTAFKPKLFRKRSVK